MACLGVHNRNHALCCYLHFPFTRRMSSTGDLYGFANKGGGTGLGIVTAWSQLLFGITVTGGGSIIFGLYVGDLLVAVHCTPNNRGMIFLWCVLLIVVANYLTYRDVRLTARSCWWSRHCRWPPFSC